MSIFERVTEHTPEFLAARGREAKDILATDVFYKAIEEAELNFLEELKYAETVEKRELAHAKIHALDGVVLALREIQSEGVFAEESIRAHAERTK